MRHVMPATAFAAAALLISTTSAAAQACLGLPTRDGDIALAATASVGDDEHFGGQFAADLTGPASVRFDYGGIGADDDRQTFGGLAAYEFWLVEPSVCAVAGVIYEDRPDAVVEERLGVPVGFGIGKTLRGPAFDATLYALPQYVWVRDQLQDVGTTDGGHAEETSNEFMAETGVTLGFGPLFAGGSVVVSTLEDRDPELRIRVGLTF